MELIFLILQVHTIAMRMKEYKQRRLISLHLYSSVTNNKERLAKEEVYNYIPAAGGAFPKQKIPKLRYILGNGET